MVKRERDPPSPFAASPSLWPFPPVLRVSRPFESVARLPCFQLLAIPPLANEKGGGDGEEASLPAALREVRDAKQRGSGLAHLM